MCALVVVRRGDLWTSVSWTWLSRESHIPPATRRLFVLSPKSDDHGSHEISFRVTPILA
jgi:hypothetical protein